MKKIRYIILHCSDSPDDLDIGVKEITLWHKEKGWNTIGYHYVIRRNSKIEIGRLEHIAGAHCFGFNTTSIGICLVGKKDFSKQFNALAKLIKELKTRYPEAEIKGHNYFNKGKTCPNFDVEKFIKEYL